MSLWRQLARGVRKLTHRSIVEAELDDELHDYYERACAELVAQGLTREEATRAARRELGDLGRARETLRSYGWENGVDALAGDFRQSLRRLRQNPGFAAIVVLTLALGIGVNVALFSLIEQILLRPLPVAEPERLVNLSSPGPQPNALSFGSEAGGSETVFSYPMFRDLERGQQTFAGVAAHRVFQGSVSNGMQARRVDGMFVSGSYFPVLGLKPALGRLLGPPDDRVDGQAESVVLSYAYWQGAFGGDPDVLGRTLIVSGTPLTVVGVAPRGFHGTIVGVRASVFVPITFRGVGTFGSVPNHDDRNFYWVYLFARLEPGVSLEEAAAGIAPLYRSILNETEAPLLAGADEDDLEAFRAKQLVLEPGGHGQSSLRVFARIPLTLLLAAGAVVLLLCCANIAGLMLVRGAARGGEMAVRASMGATRTRLASLLLAESLLLALPAAVLSLPVALLTLRAVAGGVPGIPMAAFDATLSLTAALVAGGAALVAALAFGLYPVRDLIRTEPAKTLQASGIRHTSGKRVTRFRTGLAIAQVAISMTLLAMTFLFAQSLANIARVDLGIDVDSVLTFSIDPQASGYSPEASAQLLGRLRNELATLPGVTSVGNAAIALLGGGGLTTGAGVEGAEDGARVRTYLNYVGPEFFRTLGIPLLAGRSFRDTDTAEAPLVAIVTESFAERLGVGPDVIGRRITVPGADAEIVGLGADAQYVTVSEESAPVVFLPRAQSRFGSGSATFYVRSAQPPETLIGAVRDTMARVDPLVPIRDLRTMRQQLRGDLALERFVAGTSISSAALATALAGLGLYGVLAYTVAQRAREIALRVALGAPASRVRRIVIQRTAVTASIGVLLGLIAALLLGRAAQSLLLGVEPGDPLAIAGAALVLGAVTLGAALVPLRRASRIDPMTVLRYE